MKYTWGIRRYDLGDEPVVLVPDRPTEDQARKWHASMMSGHKDWLSRHHDQEAKAPELVRCPLNWEVVE